MMRSAFNFPHWETVGQALRIGLIGGAAIVFLGGCTSDQIASRTYIDPAPLPRKVYPPSMGDAFVSEFVAEVGDRVFFDFDSDSLKPETREQLLKWVAFLKKYPKDGLTVEGHADERGTREYNIALGERRAKVVKDFLVAHGVQASRLKTVSYGKERPAVLGSEEKIWAQNRRVVGVVY
jgi:peptidoglycan-associated lipoprotein